MLAGLEHTELAEEDENVKMWAGKATTGAACYPVPTSGSADNLYRHALRAALCIGKRGRTQDVSIKLFLVCKTIPGAVFCLPSELEDYLASFLSVTWVPGHGNITCPPAFLTKGMKIKQAAFTADAGTGQNLRQSSLSTDAEATAAP